MSAEPSIISQYGDVVMNTFGAPAIALTRGQGAYVWDENGNKYLDLLGGIAVNSLGHGDEKLVAAVTSQLSELGHISNFFTSRPQVELAAKLLEIVTPGGAEKGSKVFLCNSGAEANEAAFKIARRVGGGGRKKILAIEGCFHGRTMGALALTYKAQYREPFAPLPGEVEFLPFGDFAALEEAITADVSALIVEPVQGEVGVRPMPRGYLELARKLTLKHGAYLIFDEVQAGIGRCGAWMSHHLVAPGVVPDVVTLAKGLGGGMPIGAVVTLGEEASALLGPGMHGTTFGGNPVCAAGAVAVLEAISERNLLHEVETVGRLWRRELRELDHRLIKEVRGLGLLIGIELTEPVGADLVCAARAAGFIINAARPDIIRLAPPLTITSTQGATFTKELSKLLDRVGGVYDQFYAAH